MRLAFSAGSLAAYASVGIFTGALLGACSRDSSSDSGPNLVAHCVDQAGNATCEQNQPGRPFCDTCRPASDHQGCTASPPAPACQTDGSGTSFTTGDGTSSTSGSTGEPMTTSTGTDTDTDATGTTTGPPPACALGDDGFDEECATLDPNRPYCVEGKCSGCEEAGSHEFCAALEPGNTPACDGASGSCVTCIEAPNEFSCEGTSPVCDASGACVRCDAHDDCPDTACHLDPADPLYGACFELSQKVWVDNGEICPGQGSEADPNCSLAQAVSAVTAGENVVIALAGTGTSYAENVVLDEDATIAIIGSGGPRVSGVSGVNEPSVSVTAGTVYFGKVRFADNDRTHGLDCSNATVWMRNGEARGNDGYGVHTSGPCRLVIERSNIHNNLGGGVRVFGGTARISNTAIGVNGDGSRGPGLNVQFAEIDLVYDTIVANAAPSNADNLGCLDAVGTIRNSIIVGTAQSSIDLDCFTLEYDHNAIDTPGFVGDNGTHISEVYDPGWFQNPAGGDFRLQNGPLTPFGGIALWQDGDPPFDADGTPRPQDATGYAGVDEP